MLVTTLPKYMNRLKRKSGKSSVMPKRQKRIKEIKEAKHEVKQTGETGTALLKEEFEPLKVSRFIRRNWSKARRKVKHRDFVVTICRIIGTGAKKRKMVDIWHMKVKIVL